MGTRGLIGFRVNGKDRTTYNHHDSYPEGVGADVLTELRKVKDWKKVKELVRAIRLVDEDTPVLQGTLKPYLKGEVSVMLDSNEFIRDSLFCEWAYIVNLDTGFLEIWVGFQETAWKRNRYGTKKESGHDNTYYPCKRVKVFGLDKLPTKRVFLKELKKFDGD